MRKEIRAAAFVYSKTQGHSTEVAWEYAEAMVAEYEREKTRRQVEYQMTPDSPGWPPGI